MVLRTRLSSTRLRAEQIEDRLTPSGFGPEDGAYIVEPWNGEYNDVVVRSADQKIVAAGTANPNNNSTDERIAIARYDSLGNPDLSFGTGGPTTPPLAGLSAPALGTTKERGYGVVLQPDGKAVVSAAFNGGVRVVSVGVARFTTGGALDTGYGGGGWSTFNALPYDWFTTAFGIGLQTTGKVVIAGYTKDHDFKSYGLAGRFRTNGALDTGGSGFGGSRTGYTLTTFGAPDNTVWDQAVQPDDKVVVVGMSNASGTSDQRLIVARYTASGTLDRTFNNSGYSSFIPPGTTAPIGGSVAVQSDGKIVVAGYCKVADGTTDLLVTRFLSNGKLDTGFGGGNGYVLLDVDGPATATSESARAVAVRPDGKIVVAGSYSAAGGAKNVLVAQFHTDGSLDTTFAPGGYKIGAPRPDTGYHSFEGTGLALKADGSIIVVGIDNWAAAVIPTDNHPFVMRFYGSSPGESVRILGGVTTEPGLKPNSDLPAKGAAQTQSVSTVEPSTARSSRRSDPGADPFADVFLGGVSVDAPDPFDPLAPARPLRGRVRN